MPVEPHDPDEQPNAQSPKQQVIPPQPIKLRQQTKWPDHPPRPETLLATIRKLAKERHIGWLDHSQERLQQRGFDTFDVFDALENGYINGPIEAGKKEGEWKVKVVNVPEGASRKMGVVTIVVKDQRLLLKTVEWEDR